MIPEEKNKIEKLEEPLQEKAGNWIDKLEDKIDETTEKVYNSEPYKNASQTTEKITLSLFRKAGRWWGNLKTNN